MLGVELVTDRKEKTPAKAETAVLFEKLKGNANLSRPLSLVSHMQNFLARILYLYLFFVLVFRSWSAGW